jgi:SagB-type dehydrogenase family enzyme
MDDLVNKTIQYHETTKHHFNRQASSPGYMDWANQPDPFRRFDGADLFFLPPIIKDATPSYASVFSDDLISPKTFDIDFLSRLFEMAMGITAWKQTGDSRWALRANPSSGNLHPTEAYLISPGLKGLNSKPGLYHYCPKEHGLELRTEFSEEALARLSVGFPQETFFVGLTSIHWREAWKYGERAFRYCQHDTGHALASVRIAAGALGWRAVHLEGMNDEDISHLMGLDRDDDFKEGDREHPDLILALFPHADDAHKIPLALDVEAIKEASCGSWKGYANRLSGDRMEWEIIDKVSETSLKKNREVNAEIDVQDIGGIEFKSLLNSFKRKNISIRQIVRQRRSAVSFDGHTGMSKDEFYCVLSHTTRVDDKPGIPWDAISWKPSVHLFLFVHRVVGLEPGLYFLVRNPDKLDQFKNKFKSDFEWARPANCPEGLNLFLLKNGDFKRHAAQVSCGQDIAGDSAFSLGMIAEIQSSLETLGPSQYRRLFWESGMIGQNFYLAAEFIGLRGTGIGCYFDDPVRELLGVKDSSLESFYHFTIGGPVDDSRLQTHAPYIWSEEISLGKCEWGSQTFKNESVKVGNTKDSKVVQWNDKCISRIGMGMRGMSRYRNSNVKALNAVLKTPINIFETSPDETDGEDEWLLGDTLSKLSEVEPFDRNDLFIMTRGGWVRGKNSRVTEELKKRGYLQAEVRQLSSEINLCLSPDFLKDQIERSLYRLGINYLDLFLLRMPLFIEKDMFDDIGKAFSVLEELYNEGNIKGFGLSIFELEGKEINFGDFPLEVFCEKSPHANGFQVIEIAGNFVNKRPFESEPGRESFVERAKRLGLKVIAGNPLRAKVEDKAVWLVDYFDDSSWQETAKELLNKAKNLEIEILQTPLADNRTLEEAMRDARIRSPFNFSQIFSFYLEKKEPSADDYSRLQEVTNQSLSMTKTVRDQLANAKLLPQSDFEETLLDIESLFDNILFGLKCFIRSQINTGLKEVRDSNIRDEEINLQISGMSWLFEQGVDIVLNKISRPEYLDDVLSVLKK